MSTEEMNLQELESQFSEQESLRREKLVKLQEERNLCIVFICHDIALIQKFAHEVAVKYLGNVLEILPGGKLKDNAYHPYTKALLNSLFSINMDFSEKIASITSPIARIRKKISFCFIWFFLIFCTRTVTFLFCFSLIVSHLPDGFSDPGTGMTDL